MDSSEKSNPETEKSGKTQPEPRGVALLFCTDLMFGVQLQNMARKAGLRPETLRPGAPLPHADVLVVDLAVRGDWEQLIKEAAARSMPIVAFGPHINADARRTAKAAGASRVLANSNLERDLPIILKEI
jgi:hypothetical protein